MPYAFAYVKRGRGLPKSAAWAVPLGVAGGPRERQLRLSNKPVPPSRTGTEKSHDYAHDYTNL